jgi:hypothetical protein
VLFTAIQVYEYNHILHEKLFYSEEAGNAGLYGSSFFMATGFHGFHVLIGTIFLIGLLPAPAGRRLQPQAALRLRSGGLVLALRRRGLAVPVRLHLRDLRDGLTWSIPTRLGRRVAAPAAARVACSRAF